MGFLSNVYAEELEYIYIKKKRNLNSASDKLFAVDFVDKSDECFAVCNEAFVASSADEFEHRVARCVVAFEKGETLCPDIIGLFEKSLIATCFKLLEIIQMKICQFS